ncbi:hypothetical protein [Corynebacterium lubricantis]|uniref:aromatic-ring hydroxylase C-terminal domain-containing protein n=1 Tax=Corynebacterium lubricantis TaxID=541095 RepID=UPI00316ADA3A
MRLPHAWIGNTYGVKSTHDLTSGSRFTLITGINGGAWERAAQEVSDKLGISLDVLVIGAGTENQDTYGDWFRQREIDEDGALLVRPDKHIAWRSLHDVNDHSGKLEEVLRRVLSRNESPKTDTPVETTTQAEPAVALR